MSPSKLPVVSRSQILQKCGQGKGPSILVDDEEEEHVQSVDEGVEAPQQEQEEEQKGDSGFVAPDGGWGWVIILATWLIYVLACGLSYIFTLLYQELLLKFNRSASETAWVFSLHSLIKLGFSPVVSVLANTMDTRLAIFLGAVIWSASLVVTAFAQSLTLVYIFMGGVGGGLWLIDARVPICWPS